RLTPGWRKSARGWRSELPMPRYSGVMTRCCAWPSRFKPPIWARHRLCRARLPLVHPLFFLAHHLELAHVYGLARFGQGVLPVCRIAAISLRGVHAVARQHDHRRLAVAGREAARVGGLVAP